MTTARLHAFTCLVNIRFPSFSKFYCLVQARVHFGQVRSCLLATMISEPLSRRIRK